MISTKKARIGILTGGGDCAGLNPAIKWVTTTAMDPQMEKETGTSYEVVGIMEGWKGLAYTGKTKRDYEQNILPLTPEVVQTWDRFGGTFLGTSRFNPYNPKNDTSRAVIENIDRLNLDVLIAIGGEDTLGVAARLCEAGANVIGIPKTIDKDLAETDYTLGFETAVEVITDAVDKLRTTANSHSRILVVEVMGREAGWLTLKSGESAGADVILIPEYEFSMQRVLELVKESKDQGARYNMVLVAEGAKPASGMVIHKGDKVDSFGHRTLGGIGEYVADEITNHLGFESRSVVLGHLQRGGAPCAFDRRMGRYFGAAAVQLASQNNYGKMVTLRDGKIACVEITKVLGRLNLVDVKTMYDTLRYNGSRTILTK